MQVSPRHKTHGSEWSLYLLTLIHLMVKTIRKTQTASWISKKWKGRPRRCGSIFAQFEMDAFFTKVLGLKPGDHTLYLDDFLISEEGLRGRSRTPDPGCTAGFLYPAPDFLDGRLWNEGEQCGRQTVGFPRVGSLIQAGSDAFPGHNSVDQARITHGDIKVEF